MELNKENTRRIRELEAEFSDERIEAVFHPANAGETQVIGTGGLLKGKAARNYALGMIAIVIFVFLMTQFFGLKIVQEHSMENTLVAEDCVLLSKWAYYFGEVAYDDIIITSSIIPNEDGTTRDLIKRVIGLPGDKIEIRNGEVIRNGEALYEPYTKEGFTAGTMSAVIVPKGRYFVLGDNRQNSADSRDDRIGFIGRSELRGKVLFRLLPLSRFGRIGIATE